MKVYNKKTILKNTNKIKLIEKEIKETEQLLDKNRRELHDRYNELIKNEQCPECLNHISTPIFIANICEKCGFDLKEYLSKDESFKNYTLIVNKLSEKISSLKVKKFSFEKIPLKRKNTN